MAETLLWMGLGRNVCIYVQNGKKGFSGNNT